MKLIVYLLLVSLSAIGQQFEGSAWELQRTWDDYYGQSVTVQVVSVTDTEDMNSVKGCVIFTASTVDKKGMNGGTIGVAVPVKDLETFKRGPTDRRRMTFGELQSYSFRPPTYRWIGYLTGILRPPARGGGNYIEWKAPVYKRRSSHGR